MKLARFAIDHDFGRKSPLKTAANPSPAASTRPSVARS
jgi:hypothetical protein